jgi:hypothetical protein
VRSIFGLCPFTPFHRAAQTSFFSSALTTGSHWTAPPYSSRAIVFMPCVAVSRDPPVISFAPSAEVVAERCARFRRGHCGCCANWENSRINPRTTSLSACALSPELNFPRESIAWNAAVCREERRECYRNRFSSAQRIGARSCPTTFTVTSWRK